MSQYSKPFNNNSQTEPTSEQQQTVCPGCDSLCISHPSIISYITVVWWGTVIPTTTVHRIKKNIFNLNCACFKDYIEIHPINLYKGGSGFRTFLK